MKKLTTIDELISDLNRVKEDYRTKAMEIDRVDLRFMGPVFRRGWREVGSLIGRASPASHSRRVVIWELDG